MDDDLDVAKVEQRPITLGDLRGAAEAMLVSSTYGVVGLTCVDEHVIADGKPGVVTLAAQDLLSQDREPRDGSARHTPVPYGMLTGMASQLV